MKLAGVTKFDVVNDAIQVGSDVYKVGIPRVNVPDEKPNEPPVAPVKQ